jgi:hypothetical protein
MTPRAPTAAHKDKNNGTQNHPRDDEREPRQRTSENVGTLGRLKLNCRYGYPVFAATALPYPPRPVDLAIQALALPPLTKVHIMHLG